MPLESENRTRFNKKNGIKPTQYFMPNTLYWPQPSTNLMGSPSIISSFFLGGKNDGKRQPSRNNSTCITQEREGPPFTSLFN